MKKYTLNVLTILMAFAMITMSGAFAIAYDFESNKNQETFTPQTPEYWLSHTSSWKVNELIIGGLFYDKFELIEMLEKEQKIYNNMFNMVFQNLQNYHRNENFDILLIKELIAAKLNIAADAIYTTDIDDAILDADFYLEDPVEGDEDIAKEIKDILEAYNKSGLVSTRALPVNSAVVEPVKNFCSKPVDFWKANPSLWPVSKITIGSIDYSKADLMGIMKDRMINNMFNMVHQNLESYVDLSKENLVKQLIAAKLNIEAGSDYYKDIKYIIIDADNYIDNLTDDDAEELTDLLEEYNISNQCGA